MILENSAERAKERGFALISTLLSLVIIIILASQFFSRSITQGYIETSSSISSDLINFSNIVKNIYIDGNYANLATANIITALTPSSGFVDSNGTTMHSRLGGAVAFGSTTIATTSYFTITMDGVGQEYCSWVLSSSRELFSFASVCPDKTATGCVQVISPTTAFNPTLVTQECAKRQVSRILFTGK